MLLLGLRVEDNLLNLGILTCSYIRSTKDFLICFSFGHAIVTLIMGFLCDIGGVFMIFFNCPDLILCVFVTVIRVSMNGACLLLVNDGMEW